MDGEVQRIGPDDWALWRELRLRALADAPDAFGSTLAREQAFSEDDWRALDGIAYVGLLGAAPAAIGAGWRPREGVVQVVSMWTEPTARGRGLGALVLRAVMAEAEAAGCVVELDVAVDNDIARGLYERHGFVATGERRPLRPGSVFLVERMVRSDAR